MKNFVRLFVAFPIAAIPLLLGPALRATPIGTLSIVGTGNVRVGPSLNDWGTPGPVFESATYMDCVLGPNPGACVIDGTTDGSFLVTGGTGTFAGLAGTSGSLIDLEDDFAPVNSAFVLSNFLTLAALPGVQLDATFVPLGSGTAAGCTSNPGDVCTPAGSPLTITNLSATSSIMGLSIRGIASDGIDPDTPFVAVFSMLFESLSAEGVLSQFATSGFVESAYAANITVSPEVTPIPESSTGFLLGTGLLLLTGLVRRGQSWFSKDRGNA